MFFATLDASDDNWRKYCAIAGHPKAAVAQNDMVKTISLSLPVYKHQLIAAMWMKYQSAKAAGTPMTWALERYLPLGILTFTCHFDLMLIWPV